MVVLTQKLSMERFSNLTTLTKLTISGITPHAPQTPPTPHLKKITHHWFL